MHEDDIGPTRWLVAAGAIAALVSISGQIISPLSAPASPQDGVVLTCWWVTAILSLWFGASVAAWALAIRSPGSALSRTLSRFTMPGARKFAESTFALTLIVSSAACSVGGSSDAPTLSLIGTVTTQATSPDEQTTTAPPTTTPTTTAVPATATPLTIAPSDTALPDTTPPDTEADSPTGGHTPLSADSYEVSAGDSLWSIAKAEVAAALGSEPTSAQVTRYWKELVTLNRDAILSGNPDLIYPGEIVLLGSPPANNSQTMVE